MAVHDGCMAVHGLKHHAKVAPWLVVTTTIEATSLWHRTFWWVDNRRKGTRKASVIGI